VSTVIVTGAAKGIGAGIAEAFARAGWSLVAVDRDAAQLRAAASHWGQPVATLVGDVADRATNDAAVKMAIDRFGGLDAAVGNAGVVLAKLIDDSTPEEFDRIFSINVKALMYLAQAAHKALAKSEGSLTVIASKSGLVAQRNSPLYVATKARPCSSRARWRSTGRARASASMRSAPGSSTRPMLQEFFDAMPDPDALRASTSRATAGAPCDAGRDCLRGAVPRYAGGRVHHRRRAAVDGGSPRNERPPSTERSAMHQWAFCAPRAINSSTLERNSFKVGDVFALL